MIYFADSDNSSEYTALQWSYVLISNNDSELNLLFS